jgi:transcriptional regulator
MYVPRAFEQPDTAVLQQLIREYPFATLIVSTAQGLEANHLPLVLRDDGSDYGVLAGHVARTNSVWQNFNAEQDVLVVFHGPDAYISPSYYPSKQEHGKVVPTWNYTVVHASGKMRAVEDGKWLLQLLNELTDVHERQYDQPWAVADAPAEFVEKLLNAIVGIEIPIATLLGKWKLSQNQPDQNRQGVIAALESSDSASQRKIANLVKSAS